MAYNGSDLSPEFKKFFREEKKRISKILTEMECTNIKLDYGFYYFSGFFTSKSGQVYYMSISDVRYFKYENIMYRTAKNYTDFGGGSNQYINKNEIANMKLI